jgi:outer membrane protein, multidrug efflux system
MPRSFKRSLILSTALCLALMVQACAPALPEGQVHKGDTITLPEKFPDTETTTPEALGAQAEETATLFWKSFFTDPDLNMLIHTGLSQNQELKILEQDIAIAENEIIARRGEYLPKVGAGAGYELEKVGDFTSQGVSDAADTYDDGKKVDEVLQNRHLGLFASWEVDIWKRLRNASKAAYFEYLGTIEGKKFATTRLVAEIANTYYELLALDEQLRIVNKYVENLKQAQEMVELQFEAAAATSLGVARFEAEVLKNQSQQYELKQQIAIAENNLNRLVGRFPQTIPRSTQPITAQLLPVIATGIPASLLDNRPDVMQAAFEMQSTKLDVKAAKARFYPALSIDAGVGYEAFNAKHFFETPASLFYGIAANLTAPVLNRQAIKADYFSANNRQVKAIYEYEKTLLTGYAEVANQMTSIENLQKVYEFKEKQVEALSNSFDISMILFKAARVDYLESLLTQRDFLKAQMAMVKVKKRQYLAHIELYRALGGGWKTE